MTREEAIKRLEIIATNLCGQSAQNPNLWPDYKAVDIAISALRRKDVPDKDVGKNEPLTNAQKIRAMTDDELNELFHEIYNAGADGNKAKRQANKIRGIAHSLAELVKNERALLVCRMEKAFNSNR